MPLPTSLMYNKITDYDVHHIVNSIVQQSPEPD